MTKSKFIYLTDLLLVPLFVLTVWTGIELHVAGHGSDHAVWHHWALFHTVVGLLFMAAGAIHVKSHWGWYKGLKTLKRRDKRKMVLLFSVVFLLVVVSGLALLFFRRCEYPDRAASLQNRSCRKSVGVVAHPKTQTISYPGLCTQSTRQE